MKKSVISIAVAACIFGSNLGYSEYEHQNDLYEQPNRAKVNKNGEKLSQDGVTLREVKESKENLKKLPEKYRNKYNTVTEMPEYNNINSKKRKTSDDNMNDRLYIKNTRPRFRADTGEKLSQDGVTLHEVQKAKRKLKKVDKSEINIYDEERRKTKNNEKNVFGVKLKKVPSTN